MSNMRGRGAMAIGLWTSGPLLFVHGVHAATDAGQVLAMLIGSSAVAAGGVIAWDSVQTQRQTPEAARAPSQRPSSPLE